MEITITMNQIEFIVSTVVGPLIASAYFLLKHFYANKVLKSK